MNDFMHWLLFSSPTYVRDKNYKVLHFDCLFSQYFTEWSIPKERGGIFIKKLRERILSQGLSVHGPIEIRFVKGDNFYLSPYYKQDSMVVNIVMFRPYGKNPPDHDQYFKMFEDLAISFGGRPHWAKKHTMSPDFFKSAYPKFDEFLAIRQKLDPFNMFVNHYVERHILGSAPIKGGYLDHIIST
jgi:L-gulonolactone oxidase